MEKIFTIGYASTTPDELAAMLEEHNAVLVDVRFKPYSRDSRWNIHKMQQRFAGRYIHVGELGNVNYKSGSIQLADPTAGIDRLRNVIRSQAILLLCVCYAHEKCHRTEVARVLAEAFALEVHHLYGSGKGRAADKPGDLEQLSLFSLKSPLE